MPPCCPFALGGAAASGWQRLKPALSRAGRHLILTPLKFSLCFPKPHAQHLDMISGVVSAGARWLVRPQTLLHPLPRFPWPAAAAAVIPPTPPPYPTRASSGRHNRTVVTGPASVLCGRAVVVVDPRYRFPGNPVLYGKPVRLCGLSALV